MGTVCVASSAKDGAPAPSTSGRSGRSTRVATTTVMTDVPLWQSGAVVQVTRTSTGASSSPWSSRAWRTAWWTTSCAPPTAGNDVRVEVIRAWPHRFESVILDLPAGATVADALAACGFAGLDASPATAIHRVNATAATVLLEGDRVEVLPETPGVQGHGDDAAGREQFFARMRALHIDLACQMHGGGRFSNPFLRQLHPRHSVGLQTPDAAPLAVAGPFLVPLLDRAGPRRVISFAAALGRAVVCLVAAPRFDTVLLFRFHHLVAASSPVPRHPRVIDVSDHPDIQALYLAADVMITDYSSTMFDFAVTGRPMVFYTYDLAAYRDELRGFYFDLEQEAPGPLVTTADELTAALADDDLVRRYAPAYAAFRQRYCHLDDGRATDRLIQEVFG